MIKRLKQDGIVTKLCGENPILHSSWFTFSKGSGQLAVRKHGCVLEEAQHKLCTIENIQHFPLIAEINSQIFKQF